MAFYADGLFPSDIADLGASAGLTGSVSASTTSAATVAASATSPRPTRLYLTNVAPGYTPTTKRGAWDNSSASLARKLSTAPQGATATAGVAETSTTNLFDVLLGRWISDPMDWDGDLSGTVQWIIGAVESGTNAANANMFWHMHVFVLAGDSDTVRGTVLSDSIGSTEFPITATGRGESTKTLSTVTCQAGDRVVVEVGYQAQNTANTSWTGTINYGGSSGADLTSGSTSVTTALGWIEFSDPNALLRKHVETLTDDFNDNSVDTVKWPFNFGTYTETGGQARVTALANGNFSYFESLGEYALADSQAIVYMAPPSAQDSTDFAVARLTFYDLATSNTWLDVYVDSVEGGFGWYAQVGGVTSFGQFFTPTSGFSAILSGGWFKIVERAGTLYLYASLDGWNWGPPVDTQATPTAIRASNRLTVDLEAVRSTATSAGTAAAFDNLNLAPDRTITWAGRDWDVRGQDSLGPGPNAWGNSDLNVAVDGTDLVLSIAQVDGVWRCAEVDMVGSPLGYGTYEWTYTMDVGEALDPNVVLGLFTYDYNAPPNYAELDVEISKWTAADETSDIWYTAQPGVTYGAAGDDRVDDHQLVQGVAPYTSRITWQAGQVYWRTVDANGKLLGEHVTTDSVPTEGDEIPIINLWLIGGAAPAFGSTVTATIHDFTFTADDTHTLVPAASTVYGFDDGASWALKSGATTASSALVLPCGPEYAVAYNGSVLDMHASTTSIHVTSVPASGGNGSQEALWSLKYDGDNYLLMFWAAGSLNGRLVQAGAPSSVFSTTYSGTSHAYWQIGVSGTTVTFSGSSDGVSWSTLGTATTTLTTTQLSAMRSEFSCGHWDTETGDQGALRVSGMNTGNEPDPGQVTHTTTASVTAAAGTGSVVTGSTTAAVTAAAAAESPADVSATVTAAIGAGATTNSVVSHTTTVAPTVAAVSSSPAAAAHTTTAGVFAFAGTGAAGTPETTASVEATASAESPANVSATVTASPAVEGTTDSVATGRTEAAATATASASTPTGAAQATTAGSTATAVSANTVAVSRQTTATATASVELDSPGVVTRSTTVSATVSATAPGVLTGYRLVSPTLGPVVDDAEQLAWSSVDQFNGNRFRNKGTSIVIIRNTSSTDVTATFRYRNVPTAGRTVTVPAHGEITTAVWPMADYTQPDGAVWIDWTSGSGVAVAVVDCYPAW